MKRAITLLVVAAIAVGLMAGPASAGVVYEGYRGWSVKNGAGQTMMSPSLHIKWQTGAKNVTGIILYECKDGPGYAFYKGCETSHGKTGFPSMGIGATWHYTLGFDSIGLVIRYYCDFRGSVWQNGGWSGQITCDYGSGRVAHI